MFVIIYSLYRKPQTNTNMGKPRIQKFERLLHRFEKASLSSGKRPIIFEKMKSCAQTFTHWSYIYLYGDLANKYLATEKMKETVLQEERLYRIRRNIVELFEILTYPSDQMEILRNYLDEYREKEDYLFALTLMEAQGFPKYGITLESEFLEETKTTAERFYRQPAYLEGTIRKRVAKLPKMLEKSKFIRRLNVQMWLQRHKHFCLWLISNIHS